MSKHQIQKPKFKKSNSFKPASTNYPYAFFKTQDTIQLTPEFNSAIIVKDETVLLPISLFINSNTFSFVNNLENLFLPLKNDTNLHNKKLLIIRYGGIGDVISSLFAISELKNKYPTVKIGYLTSFKNIPILKNFPNLIDYFSQPIVKLSSLKQFDYVSCLDNTIENDEDSKILSLHEIFAKYLSVQISHNTINDIFKYNLLYALKSNKLGIGIQYKSNAIIRNYDIDKTSELINLLTERFPSEPIVLLGPPNDYVPIEYLLSKNAKKGLIVNGCGFKKYDMAEIIEIVNNLKIVIGPDSSMIHIAGISNIPIIGLFGSFPSNLRLKHYNNAIGIDGVTNCSPCFKHNPQAFCKANNGMGICLNSISPQLIMDNIQQILI